MFSEVKFPVPWGHVAAKAWGPPQGHPVLCLHGWLDNANTFDRLIPLLPTDHRYVAMDFSGHGLSSHRPAGLPYHFLDYVSEVCRVAGALQWRRFTLMGHSMGGSVAGMVSKASSLHGFVISAAGTTKGSGIKGQTVWDLDLREGEALPFLPLQCSRVKIALSTQLFSSTHNVSSLLSSASFILRWWIS
uniref:Serine hydrolase like 2 n=1 Tax=Dromaius novaehollandiae TaxID=8790 RepID=A0A8C4JD41_DRONO